MVRLARSPSLISIVFLIAAAARAQAQPPENRPPVYPPNKGILVMQRLEIDGQPVRGPIRLEEDQQLSIVRIVMTYGSGGVRGQVKSQNGEAPAANIRSRIFRREITN